MQNGTSTTQKDLTDDVDKLRADVSQIKTDAIQTAQDVHRHARAHVDEARERVNKTIDAAREAVATHPYHVFGAGLFFGLLIGLRLRR